MRIFSISFFLFIAALASAQQTSYVYFVAFKDKHLAIIDQKTAFSHLSEKAILRRQKFGIKADESDYPVYQGYIDIICSKKIHYRNASKWLNGVLVDVEDSNQIKTILKNSFVADFKLVAQCQIKKEKSKTVEEVEMPFGFPPDATSNDIKPAYGKALQQIKMIQGLSLHQLNYTGKGIEIAVLDAGFYHADKLFWFNNLVKNHQIAGVKDFVENDNYVYDGNAHGLEVLSCMAALDTAVYIGTAPGATYLLLRSEDAETEQLIEEVNWAIAAEYADSCGVDLITTSLGYNEFDDRSTSHNYNELDGKSAWISRAAETAFSKGILVVCSAGNEGANSWKKIGFPADAPHVLTVGAVDSKREIADFSSRGPAYEGRIKPDITALGVDAQVCTPNGEVSGENGTSFSTPIIAGMMACLMQAFPQKTPQEINDAVRLSADRADIPDTFYGYGIPDMNLALFILGNNSFDRANDLFFNVNYNKTSQLLNFTFYSATTQQFGFKIVDEAGVILRTGTQQAFGKKFRHFHIDELLLPESEKGYAFILENDKHQTFVKLF